MATNTAFSCVSTDEHMVASNIPGKLFHPLQNGLYKPQSALSGPQLLTDKTRLKEIYELRVNVWEHSGKSKFVNRQLFPNGWSDELDETALHWIIMNDKSEIVAAARLNIFHSLYEFPYNYSLQHLALPIAFPFAFYSRLVVDHRYHGNGLSRQLAVSRILFCEKNSINWCLAFINNTHVLKLFEKLDFKNTGQANVSYHQSSQPHSVNVLIKNYHYR
ncbi:GNAT family N-acetyltransferase [Agriterribacter sp.]|uniref:GNAT family N-acetyltransferase n=1 Tax=Agriterribacter sp. TaxID=2821509 RepID=UPI002B7C6AF8|nr:GNAT family N-acetyltransferase [Agriterribacter sp.]HTN06348.1 GNAT family N-acetyltransferase [Agriterribacter sp.]